MSSEICLAASGQFIRERKDDIKGVHCGKNSGSGIAAALPAHYEKNSGSGIAD
jgi:hypothetical protein